MDRSCMLSHRISHVLVNHLVYQTRNSLLKWIAHLQLTRTFFLSLFLTQLCRQPTMGGCTTLAGLELHPSDYYFYQATSRMTALCASHLIFRNRPFHYCWFLYKGEKIKPSKVFASAFLVKPHQRDIWVVRFFFFHLMVGLCIG